MSGLVRRLARCERAAAGAEFAMVLPLLLLVIFGMIDVGRFMWEMNQVEKATEMGARYAIVTEPVSPGLVEADFIDGTLAAGDLIPADRLGALTCTSAGCTCSGTCPVSNLSINSTSFNALVARMQRFRTDITTSNVRVTYRGSGFGFAGDAASGGGVPERMEISPLVTVSVTGLKFQPLTTFLLTDFDLPAFASTLPAEDASGSYSH